LERAKQFVKLYFEKSNFDVSHDFNHVIRVYKQTLKIYEMEKTIDPTLKVNERLMILGALFHDIDDHKYVSVKTDKVKNFCLQNAEHI